MLKKSDINLKEWEFEFQQRDKHTILMSDIWCRSIFKNFQKEIKLPIKNPDCLFTSLNKSYVKIRQKRKVIKSLKKAIKKKDYVDYIFKSTLKRVKELEAFSDKVSVIKENDIKENIIELWKELDDIMLVVVPWFYIPWYVAEYNLITDRIKEKLQNEDIEEMIDINNTVAVLSFPVKKAVFQEEQKDFFELCKIVKDKKDHKDKAEKYLKEYAWMKTFISLPIEPLSMQELDERIKDALKEDFISQYEIQEKQKAENKKTAEKLLGKLKDEELVFIIEQARELGWLLTFSVEIAIRACSKLIPFYKILAKELKVDYLQWNNLKSGEIEDILQGKLKISEKELNERSEGYVFLMENGKEKMIVGENAKKIAGLIDENVSAIDKDIKEIKGQSVSPGLVEGRVRIALTPKESYKLEKGNVLVCSMTSPDYLPAMRNAMAIITDEGGLLSHAAIVSRELGKPCVVGTKIATKVLKNGDLVKVDANRGIVRIIKEAE